MGRNLRGLRGAILGDFGAGTFHRLGELGQPFDGMAKVCGQFLPLLIMGVYHVDTENRLSAVQTAASAKIVEFSYVEKAGSHAVHYRGNSGRHLDDSTCLERT